MKTLAKAEANQTLQRFLDEAKIEAFKVEVLQDYSAIDKSPSLDAWLAGDHQKSIDIIKQDGPNQWAKDYGAKPIKKTRLHIVDEPHTPYIDWEIEIYKLILIPHAGEDIRLVPSSKVADLNVPDCDFWIVDNKRVVGFHYRDGLVYAGDVYDEIDDISRFLELKTALLNLAQPIV